MKSFMWVISLIVLSTATLLTATTENKNDSGARNAKFAKGEIPLLLIRPVRRPSGTAQHYTRVPIAQSRVSYLNDDMSILGNILPQLGFDPNLFSAYSLSGKNGGQKKKHLVPIHQNEISKYHSPSNHKSDTHLSFKDEDHKSKYLFNYAGPQHSNIPKVTPADSYSSHNEYLNQNEKYLDKPFFIPTDNLPSEISAESEENYFKPLNTIGHSSQPTYSSYPHISVSTPSNNNNNNDKPYYKYEKYFEPKPIDFNLIKTKEELVIGKPTAPINLRTVTNSGFKPIADDSKGNNNFYIPKHENTASFEVKSKTDHVQFVPDFVTRYNEKPILPSSSSGQQQQQHFNRSSFELFKQTPKVEYFIPKEQETAALQVSSDAEEYYKKYETDEYFLPKREPAYHKMPDLQLYSYKQTTSTTQQPPLKNDVPESYSFRIDDDGDSDIHIQDHVYAEPEQLYYGYDSESSESSEEDQSNENSYAQTSFYPSNHKEFDSRLTALDYVQSSIKSNLNYLFENYENKKPTLISSTYREEDLASKPNLSFEPFTFSTTPSPLTVSSSEQPKLSDYKDTSYYFAKSSDDHDELHSFYSTLKPFHQLQTTPKTTYVQHQSSFSLKAGDIQPLFEPYQEQPANEKLFETNYDNDYRDPILSTKLYLNERESNNEVSTVFPKIFSTLTPSTTNLPIVSTAKPKPTTPKITTYKSRYTPTSRSTTTASPRAGISSATTHKPKKFETPTVDSGVNLLSGLACERQCIRNTVSQDYDPVCGSDGRTYSNKGKLRCTRTCGNSEVHVKHYGGCGH